MQDHNLDDLIIDTSRSKKNKTKGMLTIIALLIVVLIVAIILTKIILKDTDTGNTSLNDNTTEIIDPELTLENTTQEPKTNEDNQTELSKMIESEIKGPEEEEVKEKTVTVDETSKEETKEKNITVDEVPEKEVKEEKTKEKNITVNKTPIEPNIAKPEPVKSVVKLPVKKEIIALPKNTYNTPKKAASVKVKPKPAPVTAATGRYYIQVASYRHMLTANSRPIKILRKYHYAYKIMDENGMHKVRIGPYKSRKAANRAIMRVKHLIDKNAFIVRR